jgi:hypothetical protein
MAGFLFKYRVEAPLGLLTGAALETQLNTWGTQGFELIDLEVGSNFVILKQDTLPEGCGVFFMVVLSAFFDALGKRVSPLWKVVRSRL